MAKKSGIREISSTAKKEKAKRKVRATSVSPKKSAAKVKPVLGVAAKRTTGSKLRKKKTPAKTTKVGTKKQKEPLKRPRRTRLITEKKTAPKKSTGRKPAKTPLKTSPKTGRPRKAEERLKKPRAKITATPTAKKKSGREQVRQKQAEKTKKTTVKTEKRPTARKTVKAEVLRKRKTTAEKLPAPRAKLKKPVGRIATKIIEDTKTAPAGRAAKKRPSRKPADVKKIRPTGGLKRVKDKTRLRSIVVKPSATLTRMAPPAEVSSLPALPEQLPAEYGENNITLLTVNPYRLFAFWEVRRETQQIFKGILNLRVYDVTGIDFDTHDAHSYTDRELTARVGKMYIDVNPAKEYIADLGILFNGIFIGFARSPRVSTPGPGIPEEEEFLTEGPAAGTRVGY